MTLIPSVDKQVKKVKCPRCGHTWLTNIIRQPCENSVKQRVNRLHFRGVRMVKCGAMVDIELHEVKEDGSLLL